jgi:desulfoferrodoxin-like iron-binding protein
VSNLLGKRYQCAACGVTVLITKAGDGQLTCHGEAMEVAQAKPLPSSD